MAKKQAESKDKAAIAAIAVDISSLASYAPRALAIEMAIDGRVGKVLDWAMGDGYQAAFGKTREKRHVGPLTRELALFEALPVDDALFMERMDVKHDRDGARMALAAVELFGASPLEMILRRGDAKTFEAAIKPMSVPQFKKTRSFAPADAKWASRSVGSLLTGERHRSRGPAHELLALAAMLGKFDQAEMLIRAGFSPTDQFGWEPLLDLIGDAIRMDSSVRLLAYGVEDGADEGWDWLSAKQELCVEIEEACYVDFAPTASMDEKTPVVAKVREILSKGVAPGYYALASATQWGERELLNEMFAAGGDPNIRYKTGVPMLARLESKALTPPLLQAWLDAGADPAIASTYEEAFGDGNCPSALYQWTWEGRLDLVKQAAEGACGPVSMTFTWNGDRYSTLLALAMERGHRDIVQWLVEEKGCRLGDFGEQGRELCSTYGTPEMQEAALAWQERAELSEPGVVPEKPGPRRPPF